LKNKSSPIGSPLDDFLKEEGIFEEIRTAFLKEVFEWQVQNSIEKAKPN
jgi:antitoxin HicB